MKKIQHMVSRASSRRTLAWGALPVALIAVGCNGSSNGGGVGNPQPTVIPGATATPTTTGTPSGTPSATPSGTPGATATPTFLPGATPTPTTIPGSSGDIIVATRGGLTGGSSLLRFNSARPSDAPSSTLSVANLQFRGIDFRPANGQLYALDNNQQLYTFQSLAGTSATPTAVGSRIPFSLQGSQTGFDFNPVPDRIRVVSEGNLNLRLNPDTGAVVDGSTGTAGQQLDGNLRYADGDANEGQDPTIVAAAYTNSRAGATGTTNYAIDSRLGVLVTQGSRQGATPVVSPNSGQLSTVGSLGVAVNGPVSFDISGDNSLALATIGNDLYRINLTSGRVTRLGTLNIGARQTITGLAIAP